MAAENAKEEIQSPVYSLREFQQRGGAPDDGESPSTERPGSRADAQTRHVPPQQGVPLRLGDTHSTRRRRKTIADLAQQPQMREASVVTLETTFEIGHPREEAIQDDRQRKFRRPTSEDEGFGDEEVRRQQQQEQGQLFDQI